MAAASGIVLNACLSGLPSTQCTALAQTYDYTIHGFGAVALFSLIFLFLTQLGPVSRRPYPIIWTLTILVMVFFLAAASSTGQNLRTAVEHCYIGTDAELSARPHERVNLLGPFDPCALPLPYCGGR